MISGYCHMVRLMRFERTRVAPLPPEDSVSAISPQPQMNCLLTELQLSQYTRFISDRKNNYLFSKIFRKSVLKSVQKEESFNPKLSVSAIKQTGSTRLKLIEIKAVKRSYSAGPKRSLIQESAVFTDIFAVKQLVAVNMAGCIENFFGCIGYCFPDI